jgi:hypothetical protein
MTCSRYLEYIILALSLFIRAAYPRSPHFSPKNISSPTNRIALHERSGLCVSLSTHEFQLNENLKCKICGYTMCQLISTRVETKAPICPAGVE